MLGNFEIMFLSQSMNLTYKVKCLWILVYFSPLSFKASLSNVNENLCLFHYCLSLLFLEGVIQTTYIPHHEIHREIFGDGENSLPFLDDSPLSHVLLLSSL